MDQTYKRTLKLREPRTSVTLKATLWSERLDPREIEIHNISRRGVGARCRVGTPSAGEHVTIHIAGFPSVSGPVRWNRGDQFGVMLDHDIDPEALAAVEPGPPEPTPRPGFDFDF